MCLIVRGSKKSFPYMKDVDTVRGVADTVDRATNVLSDDCIRRKAPHYVDGVGRYLGVRVDDVAREG